MSGSQELIRVWGEDFQIQESEGLQLTAAQILPDAALCAGAPRKSPITRAALPLSIRQRGPAWSGEPSALLQPRVLQPDPPRAWLSDAHRQRLGIPYVAFDSMVRRYYHTIVAKEKVTLTLNAATLASLRKLVGNRSLSAEIDRAVSERIARLQHLAAVDELLAELDAVHGPVPAETLDWAAKEVADWASPSTPKRRRAG